MVGEENIKIKKKTFFNPKNIFFPIKKGA